VGGTYSVSGGTFTSTAGTVNNGDIVQVRLMSSSSYSTTTTATLTIGGVSGTFSVTTMTAEADTPPTAAGTLSCPTGWAASVTDSSSDDNPGLVITVLWGDGFNSSVANHGTVTHTYTKAGSYTVSIKAVDSKGQIAMTTLTGTCNAAFYSISGNTRNHADTANLGGVGLVLRDFSTRQSCSVSPVSPGISLQTSNATTGAYSFTGLKGGRYGICASKAGYTFPVTDVTVGSNVTGQKINAN
jgi:hypothetical protein